MTMTQATIDKLLAGSLPRNAAGQQCIKFDQLRLALRFVGGMRITLVYEGEEVAYYDVPCDWTSPRDDTVHVTGMRGERDIEVTQ